MLILTLILITMITGHAVPAHIIEHIRRNREKFPFSTPGIQMIEMERARRETYNADKSYISARNKHQDTLDALRLALRFSNNSDKLKSMAHGTRVALNNAEQERTNAIQTAKQIVLDTYRNYDFYTANQTVEQAYERAHTLRYRLWETVADTNGRNGCK